MFSLLLLAADLVAVGVLAFALFPRRRHRIELILVLLAANVLAFAVTAMLGVATLADGVRIGAALAATLAGGLGLYHLQLGTLTLRDTTYAGAATALGFAAALTTVVPAAQLAAILAITGALGLVDRALAARATEREVPTDTAPLTMPPELLPDAHPTTAPIPAPAPKQHRPAAPVYLPPILAPERVK
jgi:hypothetical protein